MNRGNLIWILIFLAANISYAEPQFSETLEKGQKLFHEFKLDESIQTLNKAIHIHDENNLKKFKDVAHAYFLLGVAHLSKNELYKAEGAFRKVFELDSHFKIDEKAFSPKVVELFKKIKPQSQKGTDSKEAPILSQSVSQEEWDLMHSFFNEEEEALQEKSFFKNSWFWVGSALAVTGAIYFFSQSQNKPQETVPLASGVTVHLP
ncbi:MAG: tetratricopeptide repeat protein [Deltaproteobacteria bacterium]|nr:tetratricopeptide repeat protein [Deltaproteobacteria bacterium]